MRSAIALWACAALAFAQLSATAQQSLNEAIVDRAETSLAIVDCPASSGVKRSTGVIIASDAERSYLLTEAGGGCARTVYVRGDLTHGYPARAVGIDKAALAMALTTLPYNLEVISIERGGLVPSTLSGATGGAVFVLSYPQPATSSTGSGHVQARLNLTTFGAGQTFGATLYAVRGITVGGGVFDAANGRLVGIVSFAQPHLSFDTDADRDARIGYTVANVAEIREFAKFAIERIDLGDTDASTGDPQRAAQALRGQLFPVMQPGSFGGAKGGYRIAAAAFPVGSEGGSLLLATALGRDVSEGMLVQVRGPGGDLQRAPARIVARDDASDLTILAIPNARAGVLHFSRAAVGEQTIEVAYPFCSWEDPAQTIECVPKALSKNVSMPAGTQFNVSPMYVGIAEGGALLLDPKASTVIGMLLGPTTGLTSAELAHRLNHMDPNASIQLTP